jgi:CheY-like chemotaxis protein
MSLKVLIVDDEPLIRRSLSRVFMDKGHEVKTAEDGPQGLMAWKEYRPDVVFLDVLMPGLTGPQVISELGSGHKSKVILMSAYAGTEPEKFNVAFDLFLPKPFEDIFKLVDLAESLVK